MTILDYSVPAQRRLVAERFRRIWAIVQTIADEPGLTRFDLARRFHLSERQAQADLNIIRHDMRLPLVRRQGYRFVGEGPTSAEGAFGLREAQLLVLVLVKARGDRSIPKGRLDSLIAKLPTIFPPHVAPLAERTLEAVASPRSQSQGQVFAALSDALLTGSWVTLHYPTGDQSVPFGNPTPLVQPELLLPYLGSWYVMGELQHGQKRLNKMLCLDAVTAVTIASAPAVNGRLA
jgi:predicted DNA-binding transcriptional regulator YafY